MRRIRRKAPADRSEEGRVQQEVADKLHLALERDLRLEAPDRRERPPCQNRRKRQQRGYPIPDTPAAPELCDETKKGKDQANGTRPRFAITLKGTASNGRAKRRAARCRPRPP